MSVSLIFGLPGCGKTTLYASKAVKTSNAISLGVSPYKRIYGNIHLNDVPHYTRIKFDWLGQYDIRDALVLIDEATLEADNRNYKNFPEHIKQFFLLHRHFKTDIYLFSQSWDSMDKRIRQITDNVYYAYKGRFTGKFFTRIYKVPYGIIIPDPKKSDGEKLGEIIQGYCKPNIFIRLLSPWVYRPTYYKYFDSWETPMLPPLDLVLTDNK